MKTKILSLRVNRRALGAAVLSPHGLVFADGRHLASGIERATPAAERYIERLLGSTDIKAVVVDTSTPGTSPTTDAILERIGSLCAVQGLPMLVVGRADVLKAYGVPAVHNRLEVRSLASAYWPEVGDVKGRVQPYAIDAAAAALYAECFLAVNASAPT